MKITVTVWNEGRHEQKSEKVQKIYPNGIHEAIAAFLNEGDTFEVQTATLDQPEHGLTNEVLNKTDVLIWWGHIAHNEVDDRIVEKVKERVLCGMGLIALHSAHYSKIFQAVTGSSCTLKCREADEREQLWIIEPSHPIAEGLPEHITIEHEEMYGEPFDIPTPDELIMLGWFQGGEVFRSCCCYKRGYGKVVYFQPGHETCPTYHNKDIQTAIKNMVKWAYSPIRRAEIACYGTAPIEFIKD